MALWANKLTLRKRHFFVIEKFVEDVKQEEKGVPDLLESIMRPTCLVQEELRPILSKLGQFKPEIKIPGLIQKSKVPKLVCRSPLAHFEAAPSHFQAALPHFCNIWPC